MPLSCVPPGEVSCSGFWNALDLSAFSCPESGIRSPGREQQIISEETGFRSPASAQRDTALHTCAGRTSSEAVRSSVSWGRHDGRQWQPGLSSCQSGEWFPDPRATDRTPTAGSPPPRGSPLPFRSPPSRWQRNVLLQKLSQRDQLSIFRTNQRMCSSCSLTKPCSMRSSKISSESSRRVSRQSSSQESRFARARRSGSRTPRIPFVPGRRPDEKLRYPASARCCSSCRICSLSIQYSLCCPRALLFAGRRAPRPLYHIPAASGRRILRHDASRRLALPRKKELPLCPRPAAREGNGVNHFQTCGWRYFEFY